MFISDWSSYVCSSDLHRVVGNGRQVDHRVFVSKQAWIDRSNIAEMLMIQILLWRGILRRQRSEEHTSELQSLMRISYAVFCLKKKNPQKHDVTNQKTLQYRYYNINVT